MPIHYTGSGIPLPAFQSQNRSSQSYAVDHPRPIHQGQELHLAHMSATDCLAAMTSIENAGGDAACISHNSPLLGTPL